MTINIIRVCGAMMIFLCHVCNESGSVVGSILGQVFSVGVAVFFLLSGYLHSLNLNHRISGNGIGKSVDGFSFLYMYFLSY